MSSLGPILPSLYSTVSNAAVWPDVLDGLCGLLRTRNAAVQILEVDGDHMRPAFTVRDSYSFAHAKLHDEHVNNAQNPRLDLRCSVRPSKSIVRDRDRFAPSCPQLAGLRLRLAKIGLGSSIGATFDLGPGRYFSLILHRSVEDTSDFDTHDEAILQELLPHLRQTVSLSEHLQATQRRADSLQGALDLLRVGVVLCDPIGNMQWANDSARSTIARSSLLDVYKGQLCGTVRAVTTALGQALSDGSCGKLEVIESQGETLQLRAVPLEADDEGRKRSHGVRALFLSDATVPLEVSPDDVARLFSLSPAEARLATAIAGGMSVSHYSATRGITVGTARVQLKKVLAKSRAGKQSDLTREICRSLAAQTLAKLQ